MSVDLPAELRVAVERELHGVSRRDLAERAASLSVEYRRGGTSARAIRGEADALAYALARLPATYAACVAVFTEAARLAPDFAPRRLLDAGAGPGGASWAAVDAWPGLSEITLLDASTPFLKLARRLADAGTGPLSTAMSKAGDLLALDAPASADVVVASYALAEIAEAQQGDVVDRLWAASDGLLALIEPGTPAGFGRIRAARARLIAQGARVLAPCPHDLDCPIVGTDWCHFSQRLPRSRDHRLAKGAQVNFEDEKYAYVVAARPQVTLLDRTPRVLAPPYAAKPGIDVKLCVDGRIELRHAAKRDKAAHAIARRLSWGDAL